jgi:signal transduction histidine kinase
LIFTPILFGMLSLGLGYWLSGLIIVPVTRLAGQVDQLTEDGRQTPLAAEYSNDEVGRLASSFDSYAQRLEQFAEREKEFTSDVSHELRTSIAIMRSTIELISSDETIRGATRKRLRRLEQAVRQMNELVTVFLILAREPQLSEKETAELCPVEPVLREVIDNRRATLECKGLKLRTTINGNPEVRASATVLAIVLGDVLDNAIAYTNRGQILITLDAHGVTIADTGVGIPWQEQPHIFERAYRAHKGNNDGVGLGLFIVKRLCERYGWRIDVESIEGKGTQMRFVFVP